MPLRTPGGVAATSIGPKLLWTHDATAVTGTSAMAGVTDLSGLTVAVTDSSSPTTWEQQPTNGIAVAGGWGRIIITLANIRTDLMTRAIDPRDSFVFEGQFAQTGWNTNNAYAFAQVIERASAPTENVEAGLRRVSGTVEGSVHYYPGTGGWNPPSLSLASGVSGSVQLTATGQNAIARLDDANLPSGDPMEGDVFTTVQAGSTGARDYDGLGVWAPTHGTPPEFWVTLNTEGGAGTGYCQVLKLWLLPGAEY